MFVWFSKTFGKTKKKTKKNKPISKGGYEIFKNFVVVGFPEGLFGFLWCSLVLLVFPKVFQGGLDA